jgi:hypothetical protein
MSTYAQSLEITVQIESLDMLWATLGSIVEFYVFILGIGVLVIRLAMMGMVA